jgi:hypothetical protein
MNWLEFRGSRTDFYSVERPIGATYELCETNRRTLYAVYLPPEESLTQSATYGVREKDYGDPAPISATSEEQRAGPDFQALCSARLVTGW